MLPPAYKILDISQPVRSSSAVFPGDTPFQKEVTVSYADSGVINLTAFTMSPHVGTHADAPVHIQGDMADSTGMIGQTPLDAFMGEALVVDLAPFTGEITFARVQPHLPEKLPGRILFKTANTIRYDVFESDYAWFSVDLVEALAKQDVQLIGIDTPSVDHIESKTLDTHHALLKHQVVWLENLDLTQVSPGTYTLVAFPLKMMELEASPVRAVLLQTLS
jgi:arylformamidase